MPDEIIGKIARKPVAFNSARGETSLEGHHRRSFKVAGAGLWRRSLPSRAWRRDRRPRRQRCRRRCRPRRPRPPPRGIRATTAATNRRHTAGVGLTLPRPVWTARPSTLLTSDRVGTAVGVLLHCSCLCPHPTRSTWSLASRLRTGLAGLAAVLGSGLAWCADTE